jgi:hypothetical protein
LPPRFPLASVRTGGWRKPKLKPRSSTSSSSSARTNNPNCASNTYYLVNNYNLGYKADGTLSNPTNDPTLFALPPQPPSLPTIADALTTKGVPGNITPADGALMAAPPPPIIAAFVIR